MVVVDDDFDLGLEMSNTSRASTKTSRSPRAASGLANIFEAKGTSTRMAGGSNMEGDGEGDDEVGNPIHFPGTLPPLPRGVGESARRATVL